MKKAQKKHLFARTCRVLGRFLLTIGTILCVAHIVFAFAPFLFPSSNGETTIINVDTSRLVAEDAASATITTQSPIINSYTIPSIIILIVVTIVLVLVFRQYNNTIRKFIARTAKHANLDIHATELALSTIVWTIANLIIVFNAPIFSILTFAAMLFNLLFFIFAWTSYGCPIYSI